MAEVEAKFKEFAIIPDVISTAPKTELKVNFKTGVSATNGNELTPTHVKNAPLLEWDASDDKFYTLIMTDPDAPSRKDPKFREYQHWILGNIPGKTVTQGEVLTAYVGAGPPKGTGLHRYIFLLYEQPAKIKFTESKIDKNQGQGRGQFRASKFAAKYKLGEPIAGNFFQAQWDEYVPTVHKQLSGKK